MRLRPYTDTLPKALVPVDGETTILDIALGNLAEVELTDVVIVVGYQAGAVEERKAGLESRYGVDITLVHNDKAEEWNNAYSMWLAREHFKEGVLMVNGDTVHPVSVERTLLENRGPDVLLAIDDVKKLADEEMKVILGADGHLERITKLMDPASANGEYIGATLLEAGRRRAARRRPQGDLGARPEPLLRGRLPGAGEPRWQDRGRPDRRRRLGRGRQPRRPGEGPPDRWSLLMPLLTRMLPAPLSIDVRRGAIAHLGELLADRRIATEGRVAIAVGPGQGDQIAEHVRPSLAACEVFQVEGASVDAAMALGSRLRSGSYEAVVGIGGGRTIDATKYAATLAGMPMVSVATNLSHDGICSPTASLEHEKGKASFGVTMPLAMIVDLDYVRSAPERLVRAGDRRRAEQLLRGRGLDPVEPGAERPHRPARPDPGPYGRMRRSSTSPAPSSRTSS